MTLVNGTDKRLSDKGCSTPPPARRIRGGTGSKEAHDNGFIVIKYIKRSDSLLPLLKPPDSSL